MCACDQEILGAFPPHIQCSQERLWIYHDPDHNEAINKYELKKCYFNKEVKFLKKTPTFTSVRGSDSKKHLLTTPTSCAEQFVLIQSQLTAS